MSSLVCPVRGKNTLPGLLIDTSRPASSSTIFFSATRATRATRQNLGQVEAHRLLQLRVRARRWLTIRPPAHELGGMTEAHALHVVVADLDHALGAQRDKRQVLVGVPPAGHGCPRRPL